MTAGQPRPSLKRELLLNLGILTGAALSLAVVTALIAQALEPRVALPALLFLIVADVFIVFLFGRHLIDRLVLRPMARLTAAADALSEGDLAERAPPAETQEFSELAERFNHMTDRLLDVQGQLRRAEKMATLGHLSAGIAHEVGNPLSAIGTYLDVMQKRGADPEVLGSLRRETERIDRIVRGLLAYARPQHEEMADVDVGAVIRTVVDLLTRQGRLKGVRLDVQLEAELPIVRGKTHILEQVIVNLMLNAVDAAPAGRLALGAAKWRYQPRGDDERRRGDQASRRAEGQSRGLAERRSRTSRPWRPELEDGVLGVLCWVADSGTGIAPADRERVFDPFYTTKEPGRGTGLGLAIVQRTVYELGGVVWVDDAREGGAAFKVFLPAVPTAAQQPRTVRTETTEGGKRQAPLTPLPPDGEGGGA